MNASNKIVYFLIGALFAVTVGLGFHRPVDATATTTVEKKVSVLSVREVSRMQTDIATLEKSIQEDNDFLAGKVLPTSGKGSWNAQYGQKKNDIQQNLPQKEQRLATLRSQLEMLRM